MPVATMANPPEHDFAPSWLKIPNDNQLIAKPHSDQRAGPKYPSHGDSGRQRSRHASNESSYPSFPPRHPPAPPGHPQHNLLGYRSRDEKRFRPGPRYHSLEDPLRHSELPSAYAPLHNGFLPQPPSMGFYPPSLDYQYPHHPHHNGKRGLHHPSLNHHGYHHGRSNNYEQGRGRYGGGGRHGRGGTSEKGSLENGDGGLMETGGGGRSLKGDGAGGDEGKAKSEESALSSQDFPSLSGEGDEKKNESSKPTGAWEKRPETARINIGGKKLQLVQKTTASDSPATNGSQTAGGKMASPSGGNSVANLASAVKASAAKVSAVQQVGPSKGQKGSRSAVPLSSSSSSVYKSLVPKVSTPSKATTPRKPFAKEVVIRPAPVISSKDKSAPVSSKDKSAPVKSAPPLSSSSSSSTSSSTSTASSGGGVSSPAPSPSAPAPAKEQASPRSTPAMDIPAPRMVSGKVKRTDKTDFLKELRRTGSVDSPREPLVNGTDHHHNNHQQQQYHDMTPNYRASSRQQNERTNSTPIYQQPDPFEDVDDHIDNSTGSDHQQLQQQGGTCNGHFVAEIEEDNNQDNDLDNDGVTDNGHIDVSHNDQNLLSCPTMALSSSLEAEKRLLQEMGWHEHSDNEEGYAPLTEDELKEFKLRSQQMKKNGFSRPAPVILNLIPPINAMTTMVIQDAEISSSSDTSDDEL